MTLCCYDIKRVSLIVLVNVSDVMNALNGRSIIRSDLPDVYVNGIGRHLFNV